MTMYAGDEFYDDNVTSGPVDDDWSELDDDVTSGPVDDDWSELDDDNLSGEFSDVAQGRWDYD